MQNILRETHTPLPVFKHFAACRPQFAQSNLNHIFLVSVDGCADVLFVVVAPKTQNCGVENAIVAKILELGFLFLHRMFEVLGDKSL